MRIYVGGISTETNTFSPVLMDIAQFKKGFWFVGEDVAQTRSTSKETRGVYDYAAEADDVTLVPGFVAHGVTAGPADEADFRTMQELLLQTLRDAMPVDGVVLNMHGAMQSEQCFDCEGDTFAKVRALVGPDVPITSSFDLHACVTPQMVELLDGLACFQTYPHTDHARSGYDAAKACAQLVREKLQPQRLYHTLPLVMAVENCNTDEGPIVPAMDMVKELLRHPDVLSGGLNLTQPWLDVPDLGCQITTYVRPGADTAEIDTKMREILAYIWNHRKEFEVPVPSIEEALDASVNCNAPVCVVELGDIVSAGGASDSSVALRALLQRPDLRPACVTIMDKDTVRKALEVGEGRTGDFLIGGTPDHGYNAKVPVRATLLYHNDRKVAPTGNVEQGLLFDMGMRVTLKTEDDLYIIVSEAPNYNHDQAMMTSMNVRPQDMRIIIQKTHQMFKGGYAGVMGSFLYADTEGFTDRNIPRLPFKNVRRPLYPLDEISSTEAPIDL